VLFLSALVLLLGPVIPADPCAPGSCDDANACTTDACDPVVGCQHWAVFCNDGNPCTTDTCDPGVGCVYTAVPWNPPSQTTPCIAPEACSGNGWCQGGVCVGSFLFCDDRNPCTTDSCFSGIRCDYYFSPPDYELDLGYAADGSLTWTEDRACTAVYFRVATGSLAGLPVGSQPAEERCLQVAGTQTQDGLTPDPGEGFWYVVRGYRFDWIGAYEWHGSWGREGSGGSPGALRVPAACP
jgi:hypothetical protein